VLPALKVPPVRKAHKGIPVRPVLKARKVILEARDLKVRRVLKALRGRQAHKGLKATQGVKALKEPKALREPRGARGLRAVRVLRVMLVPMAQLRRSLLAQRPHHLRAGMRLSRTLVPRVQRSLISQFLEGRKARRVLVQQTLSM
jgi:hypothetical protein